MKCTWCRNDATQGGRLPLHANGKTYWTACDVHANKLVKLNLTPITIEEIRVIKKREAQEAAKAK